MKLNNFLHLNENPNQYAWASFGNDRIKEAGTKFINTVENHYKLKLIKEQLVDSHDSLSMLFSNSVFDLSIEIEADFHSSEEDYDDSDYSVNATGTINEKYYVDEGATYVGEIIRDRYISLDTLLSTFEDVGFESEISKLLEVLKDLTDWYFDVSSEYGKIKLHSVKDDVIAVGGKFSTKNNEAKVF